jgi:RNA polymerase sigma factor (sigma-70 family)
MESLDEDARLMLRYRDGDADAFAALHAREVPEHQRPDRVAEFIEQQSALLAALSSLPQEQRQAFLLHEETGLTVEEIARVTDVGLETAKSRLRYAIRKLKRSLLAASVLFSVARVLAIVFGPQSPRRAAFASPTPTILSEFG